MMMSPTLKTSYVAWVILIVVTTAYGLSTGDYQSLMSLAVDKTGELPEGMTHDQMLLSFIAISLGGATTLIITAGFLAWKASRNKRWAIWEFTALAVWQAFDSIYAYFQLKKMYPNVIGTSDLVLSIILSSLWLYMLFATHKFKSGQSKKKQYTLTNHSTSNAGAPFGYLKR